VSAVSAVGGSVVVVGSINLDTTLDVARLPAAGETVLATRLRTAVGGKGANQAAAAARHGAPTTFVGAVGDDAAGGSLLAELRGCGVDVSRCRTVTGVPSGQALITVDAAGTNTIVVAAGANAALTPDDIGTTADAAVVLVQLEIAESTVRAALAAGRDAGATTILNPAPARALDPSLLALCDILVPNEHEAAALTGESSPERAAATLGAATGGTVVVTCGSRGAWVWWGGALGALPALPVEAIDTVAAGDAFCGVLAAALAEGRPFEDALRRAAAAGALATTVAGALPSLPTRAAVERLLEEPTIHH